MSRVIPPYDFSQPSLGYPYGIFGGRVKNKGRGINETDTQSNCHGRRCRIAVRPIATGGVSRQRGDEKQRKCDGWLQHQRRHVENFELRSTSYSLLLFLGILFK